MNSFLVQSSDLLPEEVEAKMHKAIKESVLKYMLTTKESILNQAVGMYSRKDIYTGKNDEIDLTKLATVMNQYTTIKCESTGKYVNLRFLKDERYGINVVAFLIQRYLSI